MEGFDQVGAWLTSIGETLSSDAAVRAAAWLLAGVFVVSAYEKLRRPALAGMAMADFRVIRRPSSTAGRALGLVELALGVALVGGALAGGALLLGTAAVAALLLCSFVVLIARSLRADARFDCYCFGPGGSPLSWRTLLRTASLAATALAIPVLADVPAASAAHLDSSLGIGVLCSAALVSALPRLLRWNRDPFGLEVEVVRR
jgi:hypothetical protein